MDTLTSEKGFMFPAVWLGYFHNEDTPNGMGIQHVGRPAGYHPVIKAGKSPKFLMEVYSWEQHFSLNGRFSRKHVWWNWRVREEFLENMNRLNWLIQDDASVEGHFTENHFAFQYININKKLQRIGLLEYTNLGKL